MVAARNFVRPEMAFLVTSILGENGIAEELLLGRGEGLLHDVKPGLEGGLVMVGGGLEVLVGCGGGECGGDGYGGDEFFHGRLRGLGV